MSAPTFEEWRKAVLPAMKPDQRKFFDEWGAVAYECGLWPLEFAWFGFELTRHVEPHCIGFEAPSGFIAGPWVALASFGQDHYQSKTWHGTEEAALADVAAVIRSEAPARRADFFDRVVAAWIGEGCEK